MLLLAVHSEDREELDREKYDGLVVVEVEEEDVGGVRRRLAVLLLAGTPLTTRVNVVGREVGVEVEEEEEEEKE